MNPGKITLEWIGDPPGKTRSVALLIPLFNESGKKFRSRVDYFNRFARENAAEIDVILIDDGSTDTSLEEIKKYRTSVDTRFFIASVYPNGNKVGALFMTALSISHEFAVLSDFDTDLEGSENLKGAIDALRADVSLMGCYFRMLPHEGAGNVFLFQQLEYSMHRSMYRLQRKEGIVQVMPGAGACYKRALLISLFYSHSGLRSGEDRELTSMGLRGGHKVFYMDKVLALTRPPLTFRDLVKQRVRWNLGYLETFYKERAYYLDQIGRFSSLGLLTLVNMFMVLFTTLFPLLIVLTGLVDFKALLFLLGGVYLTYVIWMVTWILVSPGESKEFAAKRLRAILLFPFFAIGVECPAWTRALLNFKRKKIQLSVENLKQIEYVAKS